MANRGLSSDAMKHKLAAINMAFLALQDATQDEGKKFAALSKASRNRHQATVRQSRREVTDTLVVVFNEYPNLSLSRVVAGID